MSCSCDEEREDVCLIPRQSRETLICVLCRHFVPSHISSSSLSLVCGGCLLVVFIPEDNFYFPSFSNMYNAIVTSQRRKRDKKKTEKFHLHHFCEDDKESRREKSFSWRERRGRRNFISPFYSIKYFIAS